MADDFNGIDRVRLFERLIHDVRGYAVFVTDPAGIVTTWGRGAEELFGYRADEIVGRPFSNLFVPDDVAAGVPARELREAAAHGQIGDDRWLVRRDGSRFWASGITVCLYEAAVIGYGKIVRDETETMTARQQIVRLNEKLLEKVQELERFEDAVVGRELKMIDLTKENERLRREVDALRTPHRRPSA
jgi:PAS domain S-box-containing protein